ncbi:hypothetical protein BD770DRAFT_410169 [Pilaira anomala]|nr:hypothetical protein BD770DRAFT_410169 [Pilaira anomala]
MSPYTKKPLTRDIPATGSAHAVPIVTTGTISKVKPTSAATKKHVNSKLGEISRQAIQSQVPSSVAPPATSNSAASPVIISDDMESSFDSDPYYLQQASLPNSQPDSTLSNFSASLPAGMTEWLNELQNQIRKHDHLFESTDSRLHHIEALLQENAQLKETVASQASELATQAIEIAELRSRLLSEIPAQGLVEEPMVLDVPRDLSSNASKWNTAPPTTTHNVAKPKALTNTKPSKVVQTKPTFAQIAAASKVQPARKKKTKPVKKPLSQDQLATLGRPFAAPTEGPSGFKYVYIGRSRKITRADTRSRFKQLANPAYESYSMDAREDIAINLQYNRCMNALLYLRNTRPYQVKPVGYSLVELGFIANEDVLKCASLTPQDPKDKISAAAGALFTGVSNFSSRNHMETETSEAQLDNQGVQGEQGESVHGETNSDAGMSDIEESTAVPL